MSKELSRVLHETVNGLQRIGLVDQQTMHEFDALALPKVKLFSPMQIKHLRRRYKASQAVFAAYLNTNVSTVQKWEQGQKKPNGISLKLLNLIDRHGLSLLAA